MVYYMIYLHYIYIQLKFWAFKIFPKYNANLLFLQSCTLFYYRYVIHLNTHTYHYFRGFRETKKELSLIYFMYQLLYCKF